MGVFSLALLTSHTHKSMLILAPSMFTHIVNIFRIFDIFCVAQTFGYDPHINPSNRPLRLPTQAVCRSTGCSHAEISLQKMR